MDYGALQDGIIINSSYLLTSLSVKETVKFKLSSVFLLMDLADKSLTMDSHGTDDDTDTQKFHHGFFSERRNTFIKHHL